jgi:hypothetical protein
LEAGRHGRLRQERPEGSLSRLDTATFLQPMADAGGPQ